MSTQSIKEDEKLHVMNDNCYLGGMRWSDDAPFKKTYVYNPTSNQWRIANDLPFSISMGASVQVVLVESNA